MTCIIQPGKNNTPKSLNPFLQQGQVLKQPLSQRFTALNTSSFQLRKTRHRIFQLRHCLFQADLGPFLLHHLDQVSDHTFRLLHRRWWRRCLHADCQNPLPQRPAKHQITQWLKPGAEWIWRGTTSITECKWKMQYESKATQNLQKATLHHAMRGGMKQDSFKHATMQHGNF